MRSSKSFHQAAEGRRTHRCRQAAACDRPRELVAAARLSSTLLKRREGGGRPLSQQLGQTVSCPSRLPR